MSLEQVYQECLTLKRGETRKFVLQEEPSPEDVEILTIDLALEFERLVWITTFGKEIEVSITR